tara:strand:- start:223 stop:462 length:240 start_codon:yes stop_codon:yes gene_type:complete
MTKDEKILEILNSKPTQKIGLDDFYGRQTVINMLKAAINYTRCCMGEAEQLACFKCDKAYEQGWTEGANHIYTECIPKR